MDLANFLGNDDDSDCSIEEQNHSDSNEINSINDDDSNQDKIGFLDDSTKHQNSNNNDQYDVDKINFIRIPWEGKPPKIIIDKSLLNIIKSPYDDDENEEEEVGFNNKMKNVVRKIYFCRDSKDRKGRVLRVWDLPLNWENDDVRSVFNIFGDIQGVTFKNVHNIIDRHCLIRYKHSSKIDFALNYDNSSIVQPLINGSIPLGIKKYLIHYIKSRPHNIDQLKHEINKFMLSFDKLVKLKKQKERLKPRRNRGWIQKREKDGFKKIHYVNKFQRKKNKAYKLNDNYNTNNKHHKNVNDIPDNVDGYGRSLGEGKMNPINPNDTFNMKPERRVYDKSRKESYYRENQIKDVFKNRQRQLFMKRAKNSKKVKKQISDNYLKDKKQRMSIAEVRLKDTLNQKKRLHKDMENTTNLRKNRKGLSF